MEHDNIFPAPDSGVQKTEKSIEIETESPPTLDQENSWIEDPNHPRNWPKWKKNSQILMVAFHSMGATFMAAGIIPANEAMAEEYGVALEAVSYFTAVQILLLGVVPAFWKPITSIYGRYHVFLFAVVGCMLCNIGGACCTTYGAQMATRIIAAICICPPLGIGSGVITELCEPHERAQKIGWWILMLTLGTPGGPLVMGFVSEHIGWRWIFWLLAILNFIQFILYVLIGDETIYPVEGALKTKSKDGLFSKFVPRRLDPRPLNFHDFIQPMLCSKNPRVMIPTIAHSVAFCYGNIAIIVEMPIVFGQKFNFDAQQVGLQFIAIIIGCLLGEQLGGPTSDWFLRRLDRKRGSHRPADRLWLSYIGYGTIIAGLLIWGFQLDKASSTWNVTPCVGAAIASFGNQVIMTILISFAVDSDKERSTDIGVCMNVYRQIFGFIGPFYFPAMFDTLKFSGAAGLMCALIFIGAVIPTIAIQFVASRHEDTLDCASQDE